MRINAFLFVGCMTAAVSHAGNVLAQESSSPYPSRTLRFVVPGVPGGLNDFVARVLADNLMTSPGMNGQSAIVDNRSGGGGILAAQYTASAPADGYTILFPDLAITAIIPALYDKPPYDTLRDFVPVSGAAITPFFLAVRSNLGITNLKELVAVAKAKPGQLFYGSSGNGTPHHLATEVLKTSLGIDIVHVPYKGSGQSTPALLAGDIQILFSTLGQIQQHVKDGKVRLLAVTSAERSPREPDVPTLRELGVKDVTFVASVQVLAPAGTSPAIIAKLSTEIRKALQNPELRKRFETFGVDAAASNPDETFAQIKADQVFFTRAVKISGAKASN